MRTCDGYGGWDGNNDVEQQRTLQIFLSCLGLLAVLAALSLVFCLMLLSLNEGSVGNGFMV